MPLAVPSTMSQESYDRLAENLRDAGLSPEQVAEKLSFITVVPADDPAIQETPAPEPGAVI